MLCTRFCNYYAASGLLFIAFASSSPAAVIFSDTFDRGGSQLDDIDATTAGVTAAFALPSPLYVERDEFLAGPANAGPLTQADANILTNIENNQLHLADGPNASALHINHNFVGAGIVGMKASLDVLSNDGLADENARWVGLGFGGSQSEADAAQFDFGSTVDAPSWKGNQNGTTAGSGFADFFVAWERRTTRPAFDQEGRITIWKNGVRGQIFNPDPALVTGGKLEVELSFDDFTAGTTVDANIYYAGVLLGTDTFNWENTDTNYIGITGRQDLAGWTVDNLAIEATTIPEPGSAILLTLLVSAGAATGRRVRATG